MKKGGTYMATKERQELGTRIGGLQERGKMSQERCPKRALIGYMRVQVGISVNEAHTHPEEESESKQGCIKGKAFFSKHTTTKQYRLNDYNQ